MPRRLVVAVVAVGCLVAPEAGAGDGARPCLGLGDRRLEVCTAYVVNATLGARVPYYKVARSGKPARVRLVTYRLESRYVGAALRKIKAQVRAWPKEEVDVDVPDVDIVSIRVDGNRATLVTRESWEVETEGGRSLFAESDRRHVVQMRRVGGLVLHKWVVERFS